MEFFYLFYFHSKTIFGELPIFVLIFSLFFVTILLAFFCVIFLIRQATGTREQFYRSHVSLCNYIYFFYSSWINLYLELVLGSLRTTSDIVCSILVRMNILKNLYFQKTSVGNHENFLHKVNNLCSGGFGIQLQYGIVYILSERSLTLQIDTSAILPSGDPASINILISYL